MKVFEGELFATSGPHKGGYLPGRWVRAEEAEAALKQWEHACTGKNGSQIPCVQAASTADQKPSLSGSAQQEEGNG